MKAIYLVFHDIAEHSGITKKMRYQVQALNQCGIDTELCYLGFDDQQHSVCFVGKKIIYDFGKGFWSKIKKRFDFSGVVKYVIKEHIDLVYIRSFYNANPFLLNAVRELKFAGVKVLLEYPTYPYENEFKEVSWDYRLIFYINKFYRRELAANLDAIVTFSDYAEIDGQRTIVISNGIDFDSIPLKKSYRPDPPSFNLLAVAELHYWHGFDRAIKGLAEYYKRPRSLDVYLHIVGKGTPQTEDSLHQLVLDHHLDNYVIFHGSLSGKALDDIFERCDMGIASLGRHRTNITKIKTLKNREYAARGIPFVYSEIDDDFEQMPYVLKVLPDESPLNIAALIKFYYENDHIPAAIRASIEGTLSWKKQMNHVLNAL